MDQSNGYESVAAEFLAGRGSPKSSGIGAGAVGEWARQLSPGSSVLDLGCGSGLPITVALIRAGLDVYAIDAAPSFVDAFKRRFPTTPIACEAVEESSFFGRKFDAILAWGLMFLLPSPVQRALILRIGGALKPAGRLLFTSPPEPITWNDAMTGLESRSLGAAEYRRLLSAVDLTVLREYEDEGENHYYDAIKAPITSGHVAEGGLATP
jgi:2-polyprenyl-3-methyl-5-hydroxy-6-metoxy-1,4-benzoquinol methylase